MAKECESCAYRYEFKSVECGSCMVSYYDGEQQGLPSNFKPKPQTNADRIRAMSDEKLATHLYDIGWDCHLCAEHRRLDNEPLLRGEKCDEKCAEHCLEWLKQPVED